MIKEKIDKYYEEKQKELENENKDLKKSSQAYITKAEELEKKNKN